LQNEFDNSGIKGIEEQDLGQVEVTPNEQETSAFPQFTDAAKQQRGIENFKSFKKGIKKTLPYIPNFVQEFVPGADLARQFGVLGDIGGEQTYQPSTGENIAGGIEKIRQGDRVGGGVDLAIGGLETLGATADAVMLGSAFAGPLAPALLAAGVVLKGVTKGGKAILQSKSGRTFFGKLKEARDGVDDVAFTTKREDGKGTKLALNIESIEAPQGEDVSELMDLVDEDKKDLIQITNTNLQQDLEADPRKNFYRSRLLDTVETLQNKATGEQYLGSLQNLAQKGRFSKDELEHSLLDEYLKDNSTNKLTKEDLLDYMEQNTPDIKVNRLVHPNKIEGQNEDIKFSQEEMIDFEDSEFGMSERFDDEIIEERGYADNNNSSFINQALMDAMYRKEFPEEYERYSLLKASKDNPESALNIGTLDEESIIKLDKKFDDIVKNVPNYELAKKQGDLFEPEKKYTQQQYFADQAKALRNVKGAKDYDTNYKDIEPELIEIAKADVRREYNEYPNYVSRNPLGYQIVSNNNLGGFEEFSVIDPDDQFVQEAPTYNEAEIIARRHAAQQGFINQEEAIFSPYVTGLGNPNTYEEIPLSLESPLAKSEGAIVPTNAQSGSASNHMGVLNNIGHIRVNQIDPTSQLANGRRIYLVEEFQKDGENIVNKAGGYGPSKKDMRKLDEIAGMDNEVKRDSMNNIIIDDVANNIKYRYYPKGVFSGEIFASKGLTKDFEGFVDPANQNASGIHPKNQEIVKYLKDNNLEPRSPISNAYPLKKNVMLNFRTALKDAIDKGSTHFYYVAGEVHALRYGEAIHLLSADRVPDSLFKDKVDEFNKIVKDAPAKLNRYYLPLETRANRPYDLKAPTENTYQARLKQIDISDENFLKAVKDEDVQFYPIGEDTIVEGTTDDLDKILKKIYGTDIETNMREDFFKIKKVIPTDQTPVNLRKPEMENPFNTTEKIYSLVAGRDGQEIVLPFDIEMMREQNPEMASRLEDYASSKTQDDFFDDLIIVDIALPARSDYDAPDTSTESLLRHLLVNKENNDVLGSFYNNDLSSGMRTAQQGNEAKFHRSNEETSTRTGDKLNLPYYFKQMNGNVNFNIRDQGRNRDLTPKNLKDFLTKEQIEKIKGVEVGKTPEDAYFDQFTDIDLAGNVLGGESKKKLYNDIIKKQANKYLKSLDPEAKLSFEKFDRSETTQDLVPVYGVKITNKMREKILSEGVDSFSQGGLVVDVVEKTPTKIIKKYKPHILKKNYGAFVDNDNNKWDYIDG